MSNGFLASVLDAITLLVNTETDGHEGRRVSLGSSNDAEVVANGAEAADHYCAFVSSGDVELMRVAEL